MSESQLKREFRERDVQRMRNIITKDYTAKTVTQVGYSKAQVDHKEGDVWEEDGKKWTLKNGIKQSVTRFDSLKKAITLPIACPKCNKGMKSTSLNKKMWPIHKMCFDCVVDMETKLKIEGKYEEYEKNIIKNNANFMLDEFENGFEDFLNSFDSTGFVTEQGDVEKWVGKGLDINKLTEEVQEHIQKLKDYVNK